MSAFTSKFKTSTRVILEFDETCNLTQTQTNQVRRTILRRARRSKKHESNTSDLKKNENHQKANYSKNSSSHSSKYNVRRDREHSKNVKACEMNKELFHVV
jgi:hypothetical protein